MKPTRRKTFVDPRSKVTGRRTGINIRATKTIHRRADGFEDFNDYMSESDVDNTWDVSKVLGDSEDSKENKSSNCMLPPARTGTGGGHTQVKLSHSTPVAPRPSKVGKQVSHKRNLSSQRPSPASQSHQNMDKNQRDRFAWFRNKNIGRRTGKDLRSNKNIRVDNNGLEIFDDYLSESDYVPDDESILARNQTGVDVAGKLDSTRDGNHSVLSRRKRSYDVVSRKSLTAEDDCLDGGSPTHVEADGTGNRQVSIVRNDGSSRGNQTQTRVDITENQGRAVPVDDDEEEEDNKGIQAAGSDGDLTASQSGLQGTRDEEGEVVEEEEEVVEEDEEEEDGDVEGEVDAEEEDGSNDDVSSHTTQTDIDSAMDQSAPGAMIDDDVYDRQSRAIMVQALHQSRSISGDDENNRSLHQSRSIGIVRDEKSNRSLQRNRSIARDDENSRYVRQSRSIARDNSRSFSQSRSTARDDENSRSLHKSRSTAGDDENSRSHRQSRSISRDDENSRSLRQSRSTAGDDENGGSQTQITSSSRTSSRSKSIGRDDFKGDEMQNEIDEASSPSKNITGETDDDVGDDEALPADDDVSSNRSQSMSQNDYDKSNQTKTAIDVAGNRSGSITRLDIQATSAISFNRTRKRLSYSAEEESIESQRTRKLRVEEANANLNNINSSADQETQSRSKSAVTVAANTVMESADRGEICTTLGHAEELHKKTNDDDEFLCLASRSMPSVGRVDTHDSEDDISIVELDEPDKSSVRNNRKTKSDKQTKKKGSKKGKEAGTLDEKSDDLQHNHKTKKQHQQNTVNKLEEKSDKDVSVTNVVESQVQMTPKSTNSQIRIRCLTSDMALDTDVNVSHDTTADKQTVRKTGRRKKKGGAKGGTKKKTKSKKEISKSEHTLRQPEGDECSEAGDVYNLDDSGPTDNEDIQPNVSVNHLSCKQVGRKSTSNINQSFMGQTEDSTAQNTVSVKKGQEIIKLKRTASISSTGNYSDSDSKSIRSDSRKDRQRKSLKVTKSRTSSSNKNCMKRKFLSTNLADSESTADSDVPVKKKLDIKTYRVSKDPRRGGTLSVSSRRHNGAVAVDDVGVCSRRDDGESAVGVGNGSPANTQTTPARDSHVSVPTNFSSGVSFRACRRSEVLDGVRSGYLADMPAVEMGPVSLPSCLCQPGSVRRKSGRRVTIGPEEDNQQCIISDDESTGVNQGRYRSRMSSTGDYSGLPTPSCSPMHVFETTSSAPSKTQQIEDRLIMPCPAAGGLRRSQRTRTKPIQWHKGERLIYDYSRPERTIIGVKPSNEVKYLQKEAEKRKRRKLMYHIRKAAREDKKSGRRVSLHARLPADASYSNSQEITVYNPCTDEEDGIECLGLGDANEPVGPNHGTPTKDDPYLMTTCIDQPVMSVGSLTIKSLAEKPESLNSSLAVVYKVEHGAVVVRIHKTSVVLKTGDTFFVPLGNTYSIRNMRKDDAKLSYTFIKSLEDAAASETCFRSTSIIEGSLDDSDTGI